MADKDVPAIVRNLASSRALAGGRSVATTLVDTPRAMPPAELASIWRHEAPAIGSVSTEDDPIAALERSMDVSAPGAGRPGSLTVVAGSLYLVGVVRGHLVDDPAGRDPGPAARDARSMAG
jgi:folylpolyglutamate synthase/dihydropteroate synthase